MKLNRFVFLFRYFPSKPIRKYISSLFGFIGSVIGFYIWKSFVFQNDNEMIMEINHLESLGMTIFLYIPSSIALIATLFDKTHLKYLAFLLSLPVFHFFSFNLPILPLVYVPSLTFIISAVLSYTPSLTEKEKMELENIISKQVTEIVLETERRRKEALFNLEQKNTISSANQTDPEIEWIYQINLSTAKYIKNNFERYLQVNGSAFANTYRLGIFYALVRTNGIWDLKQSIGEKTLYEFKGTYKMGEYIGNHHYGYIGKAIGLNGSVLKLGGGIYQVYSGTSEWRYICSYFDDPKDLTAVKDGIMDYDNGCIF